MVSPDGVDSNCRTGCDFGSCGYIRRRPGWGEEARIAVNRKAPVVTPLAAFPKFSVSPSDEELFRARVFEEPLVPVGGTSSPEENRSLASALLQYLKAGETEN